MGGALRSSQIAASANGTPMNSATSPAGPMPIDERREPPADATSHGAMIARQ